MKEKSGNKREWIKTAAIIFLAIMLVLTFFSNTIMNYSLPQVAAQYVQSGTITAKVRGTGNVESGTLYEVKIAQSRKVTSVEVKVGDVVEIGDVLFTLADQESTELETAKAQLDTLVLAFEKALLDGTIDLSVANNAQNGVTASVSAYQSRITNAKAEVQNAQNRVDYWQEKYDALTRQIAISSVSTVDTRAEEKAVTDAQTALTNAQTALSTAQSNVTNLEDAIKALESVSSGDAGKLAQLNQQLTDAKTAVVNATNTVASANVNLTNAQAALTKKKTDGDTTSTVANLTQQQAVANANLLAESTTLKEKTEDLTSLVANIQSELDLGAQNDAIRTQQELVAKLESESVGADIKAEIAGTITAVSVVAGGSTTAGESIATIQPAGKGYTVSFTVTNEQATRISVGDPAELVNSWWYSDVTAQVASIKPDTTNPNKNKLVTFTLDGELTAGQSISLSVGQRSSNYDMIVPNSAIREDNNGKFILTVESKSSPLGNRYIATRVDVEVLASDDTQSAISGGLYGYEFVITTSTKPIEAGKQVRLAE